MYLIDQHAAHERILYERFMSERARHSLAIQNLLEPRPVEVPVESISLLTEHLDLLAGIGVTLEPFGGMTFLLRSVPGVIARQDPQTIVNDIVAEIDATFTHDSNRPLVVEVFKDPVNTKPVLRMSKR